MLKIDPDFLRQLLSYIKSTYLPPKRHNPKHPDTFTSGDLHFFAPTVAELSAAFTFERSARRVNYFNTKEARSSYLLYFLIPNMLKVQWILEQQRMAEWFADEPEVRVADIGCGPCTGLLAVAQYWQRYAPQQQLSCVGVDQSAAILKDGQKLMGLLCKEGSCRADSHPSWFANNARGMRDVNIANQPGMGQFHIANSAEFAACPSKAKSCAPRTARPRIDTYSAQIKSTQLPKALGTNQFHILIVANILNELRSTEERYDFIRNLMARYLASNGRIIIIEPALQRATRDLMTLHDQVVALSNEPRYTRTSAHQHVGTPAHVLSPCLHQALCPMRAANPRDWCHTYLEWERPQVIADLDMLIGNKKNYLKMAYMVLCGCSDACECVRNSSETIHIRAQTHTYRVVSAPMKSKGKLELLLCGENCKLLRVTRLDKDCSPKNSVLDSLQRGDVVHYVGDSKCGRETAVSR